MAQQPCYFYSPSDFSFVVAGVYDDTAPLPSNSTTTAPPGETPAHTVNVWNSGEVAWDNVPDLRGTRTYSEADGSLGIVISAINTPIPNGYTSVAPPDSPNFPTVYDWSTDHWVLDNNKLLAQQTASARLQRNAMLGGSDWVENAGTPLTTANLQDYAKFRQWLRDVPAQTGFPNSITWPATPAYAKNASLDNTATKQAAIQAGYSFAIANPLGS